MNAADTSPRPKKRFRDEIETFHDTNDKRSENAHTLNLSLITVLLSSYGSC